MIPPNLNDTLVPLGRSGTIPWQQDEVFGEQLLINVNVSNEKGFETQKRKSMHTNFWTSHVNSL